MGLLNTSRNTVYFLMTPFGEPGGRHETITEPGPLVTALTSAGPLGTATTRVGSNRSEWTSHESDSNHESLFKSFLREIGIIESRLRLFVMSKMQIKTDESSVFSGGIKIRFTISGHSFIHYREF